MWLIEKIIKKGDYRYCIVRNHPNRTSNDYVLLHRVIVENNIGRLLSSDEVVHHIDGNKLNNSIENLEILLKSDHNRLHALEVGSSWAQLRCPECGKIFDIARNRTFLVKKTKWTSCSNSCRGKFSRKIQLHGITSDIENAISKNLIKQYRKYLNRD
jgi:hypothetical protein